MKKCIRKKTVTNKYGKRVKRCAEFGNGSMGALPEVWEGLGEMDWGPLLGPAVGGGVAMGATLLAKGLTDYGHPVHKYAGLIGAGAGLVAALPVAKFRGWGAAGAGMLTALLTGLNTQLGYMLMEKKMGEAAMAGLGLITPEEVEGLGLITPEEVEGLGLITPEEVAGYTDDVDVYEGGMQGQTEVLEGVNYASFGRTFGPSQIPQM